MLVQLVRIIRMEREWWNIWTETVACVHIFCIRIWCFTFDLHAMTLLMSFSTCLFNRRSIVATVTACLVAHVVVLLIIFRIVLLRCRSKKWALEMFASILTLIIISLVILRVCSTAIVTVIGVIVAWLLNFTILHHLILHSNKNQTFLSNYLRWRWNFNFICIRFEVYLL